MFRTKAVSQKNPLQAAALGTGLSYCHSLPSSNSSLLCAWFRKLHSNYTNHTYTTTLHQGPEMKGESCFSQFCSEQKSSSPSGSADTPNPWYKGWWQHHGLCIACQQHIWGTNTWQTPLQRYFGHIILKLFLPESRAQAGLTNRPELSVAKMVTSKVCHSSEMLLQDNT